MTAQPTSTRFSQEDAIFRTYLEDLPGPLLDALVKRKLTDPGLLPLGSTTLSSGPTRSTDIGIVDGRLLARDATALEPTSSQALPAPAPPVPQPYTDTFPHAPGQMNRRKKSKRPTQTADATGVSCVDIPIGSTVTESSCGQNRKDVGKPVSSEQDASMQTDTVEGTEKLSLTDASGDSIETCSVGVNIEMEGELLDASVSRDGEQRGRPGSKKPKIQSNSGKQASFLKCVVSSFPLYLLGCSFVVALRLRYVPPVRWLLSLFSVPVCVWSLVRVATCGDPWCFPDALACVDGHSPPLRAERVLEYVNFKEVDPVSKLIQGSRDQG